MELTIYDRIRVRKLIYFEVTELVFKYDSLDSSFKFEFLFDPDNPEHKDFACIGHYHIVKISHNGETLLTGFMISNAFNDFPEQKLTEVAGFSLPGVLTNCEVPFGEPESWLRNSTKAYAKRIIKKIWPKALQSDGLSLREIAAKILSPFELEMVVHSEVATEMDEKYDETTAREKQTAKAYLCELAAQKNIIITDNQFGQVVFTRPSVSQKSIFHFDKNIPGTSMGLVFDGSRMHSHIKVFQQQDAEEDVPSSEALIENPYVPFVFRPHVAVQSSGDANNTENAARNVLAKELKGMVLTIHTDRWIIDNKVIRPGVIISVTNPKVYCYKRTNWFVEEVSLKGSPTQMTATLKCVVPEVYNGGKVSYLFEGINLH
jgi:hypothetical protein